MRADYETSFFTCSEGEGELKVRINTWVYTYKNGDKSVWTTKDHLCEGLHSATDVHVDNNMKGPFADDDPNDLFKCAVADAYGRPEASGRHCSRPW